MCTDLPIDFRKDGYIDMKLQETSTVALARFAHDLVYEDIPEHVRQKARYLLLDYIGGMIPGNKEEMAGILDSYISKVSGPAEARLIGTGKKAGAIWAALYNGAVGHLIDMDDIHWPSVTHCGVNIWSSALAMAEKMHSTGEETLVAAVAGFEVALRIGIAIEPDHYVRGFNPSGTIMTFGAATVAAKLLKLDVEKTTHALGMAAVMVAGNKAHLTERSMTKDYNSGFSSKSGIEAALLAQEGFTASTDELENPCGFLHIYGGKTYPDELTKGFREKWHILDIGQKLYPACRCMHSSVEAILDMRDQIDPEQVVSITTKIFATGAYIVDDKVPWTHGIMGARFSAQFNMAVALVYGIDGMWDQYNATKAMSYMDVPLIRDLVGKTSIVYEKEWDGDTGKYEWCETEVTLTNGQKFYRRLEYARGGPQNPIPWDMQEKRFQMLLSQVGWREDQMYPVLKVATNLDSLKDIEELMQYL